MFQQLKSFGGETLERGLTSSESLIKSLDADSDHTIDDASQEQKEVENGVEEGLSVEAHTRLKFERKNIDIYCLET